MSAIKKKVVKKKQSSKSNQFIEAKRKRDRQYKAAQRLRDREDGFVEVLVKIKKSNMKKLRACEAELQK